MPDIEDPRKGLPSASAMPRYFACAGAWEAEKDIKEPESSEDSKTGTARHEMLEGDKMHFQDAGDEFAVTRARELVVEAMERSGFEDDDEILDIREERLWLSNDDFENIVSGQPDRVLINKTKGIALICDYKLLFGNHTEAKKNEQLITLAVLVAKKYKVKAINIALIQPNLPKESALTMCAFTKAALKKAEARLVEKLEFIGKGGHPRTVNQYCNFCKFRLQCPQANEFSATVISMESRLSTKTDTEMLGRIELAKKLITDMEKEHKARAVAMLQEDETSLPGYKLATKKATTVNTEKAWSIILQNMPANDAVPALTVSIPKLVAPFQAYCKEQGVALTLEAARKELDERLASAITTTEGDPFIKKV